MEWLLKIIEKMTGKHFHSYMIPSAIVYFDEKVDRCRCGAIRIEKSNGSQ